MWICSLIMLGVIYCVASNIENERSQSRGPGHSHSLRKDVDRGDNKIHAPGIIQIQPGTKYDGFFDKVAPTANKVSSNLGYVSVNWLFKIEIENEDPRPSRNKT